MALVELLASPEQFLSAFRKHLGTIASLVAAAAGFFGISEASARPWSALLYCTYRLRVPHAASLADEIRPAVEHLERAAGVTAEELRERWEKYRAIWERFRGRL